MRYSINTDLFQQVPDFRRGVVVAKGCDNSTSPSGLVDLLFDRIRQIGDDSSISVEDERIQAWTTLYKRFPAPKGERVRPSIWSLVRRIQRGDGAGIPFISPLVAISNLVSLTFLTPSGLVDRARVSGDLSLTFATGEESFLAFGKDSATRVEAGEVIYIDSAGTVMCRAWNSRGGQATGILSQTSTAIIDVDGLMSILPATSHASATKFAAELVTKYCGGSAEVFYLDAANPNREIDV